MLAGSLSKENAWVAPVLIVAAEYGVVRHGRALFRSRWESAAVPLATFLAALVFVVTLFGLGPLAARYEPGYAVRDFTMSERVLTQPRVVLFHLSQIFWPAPSRFSLEHEFPLSRSLIDPPVTAPAAGLVFAWCALAFVLLGRRRSRIAGFLMLWIPLTLAIESSFVALEMVFEHRMYLPSFGLFGLFALAGLPAVRKRPRIRPALAAAAVGCIVILSGITMSRVAVWESRVSLAEDSVRNAPGSARVWATLGKVYLEEGDVASAEPALQHALQLDPNDRGALEFWAVILMDRGRLDEARGMLLRALAADPESSSLANHLGEVLLRQGEHEQAEVYFREAVTRQPWVPAYHWNLALALEGLERCDDSLEQWNAYLDLEADPVERGRVVEHVEENYRTVGGRCAD